MMPVTHKPLPVVRYTHRNPMAGISIKVPLDRTRNSSRDLTGAPLTGATQ